MDDLKALKEEDPAGDVEEAVVVAGAAQGLEIVVEVGAGEGKDVIVVALEVDLVAEVGNVTNLDLLDVKIVLDLVPVGEKISLNRQLQQQEGRISPDPNLVLGQNHLHLLVIDDGNLALGLAAHQKHATLKKLFQKGLFPEVEVVHHLDRTMTDAVNTTTTFFFSSKSGN